MTTVDEARAAYRNALVGAMPWYDEANPDYTEVDTLIAQREDALIAAVRAEYEPDADGFSPGCGPYNHPLTCKCPFVRRAESAETLRALREAARPVVDFYEVWKRGEDNGYEWWNVIDPLRAALAATPAAKP